MTISPGVLGDQVLTQTARDLTETIRSSVSIDWTVKETVRAKLRTLVRRKLRKYGDPPDKTEKAVETVLRQAEPRRLAASLAPRRRPRPPRVGKPHEGETGF